nr:response regulator [Colwellia sp. D2M02]
MERTAKSCNIDLIVNVNSPEVLTLVYGFIHQYHIYQSQHALIVDDSRVDSYIVENILSKEFIKNTIELNPNNVINLLHQISSITLIILDYEMPNKNGCQLMDEIRNTFPERHFIFIGITASRNAVIKFLYDAADATFIKPLDLELFSVTLRKLIFNAYQSTKERQSLIDYKNIINSLTKDIFNPLYILSTINEVLVDSVPDTKKSADASLLCQKAKDKIEHTFADLQSYIELSQCLHSPNLKACSLNAMIAGQLYIESSKAKIKNIIINQSLDEKIKKLCVPNQVEQVITHLTKHAIDNSTQGDNIYIRLYPDKFNIVFEVEDSKPCMLSDDSKHLLSEHSLTVNSNAKDPLDIVLNKKIIDALGGTTGEKQGKNGTIYYFELPSYALTPSSFH